MALSTLYAGYYTVPLPIPVFAKNKCTQARILVENNFSDLSYYEHLIVHTRTHYPHFNYEMTIKTLQLK